MRPLRFRFNILSRLGVVVFGLGLCLVPAAVSAQTVTQSYTAGNGVQQGMIVKLDSKDATKVDPLTLDSIQSMQGVVVAASDSTVTLSNDGKSNQVYVATTGKYNVLVSNQNGSIKSGDYITISSLAGVGMKADGNQLLIVGRALEGFNGSNNVSGTADLKTSGGGSRNVSLGLITVDIGVARNPLLAGGSNVPGVLQKASQAIANKPVSAPRLYMSLVVLLLTVFIVGSFLYGGVRSSLTSIGRNPMAKKSILRGLFQVVLVGLIIFIIGLSAVYLILKL